MLSSKLKSWVESHLTRKKSSAGGSGGGNKKSASGLCNGKESPADRIAHPAASLVNLVPAVPLCSTSGRSNAGLVIRLQNDFAAASSVSSPCHRNHHPSWSRSPVMLAWNTKIPPRLPSLDPPISPPASATSTMQQNGEPSPSGSDWTSKSFAGESGIGGGSSSRAGGSLASSRATGSSMCGADFETTTTTTTGRGRGNAPSLSSPESAYSTGCSDGVSPSQDGLFDAPHQQPLILDPVWRRSLLDAEGSGTNSSTQSPRTRPAIRTNPWLPVRTSLTSSDRASWMTDSTPEAVLAEIPAAVKETDIVSSDDDDDQDQDGGGIRDVVSCPAVPLRQPPHSGDRFDYERHRVRDHDIVDDDNEDLDRLCDSLELLMDGDNLRVSITHPVNSSYGTSDTTMSGSSLCRNELLLTPPQARRWDVDDQYTLLIRQTEEILLQLEKDELLLAARKQQPDEHELLMANALLPSSAAAAAAASVAASMPMSNSRPCSVSSSSGPQYRRRLRKTAGMRRCSSRNSSGRDFFSSSESSDCEYSNGGGSSNCRRTMSASLRANDGWHASRRPRSANRNNSITTSGGITARFAPRQNGRVLPQLPTMQHQQSLMHPLAAPPAPPRDCWILGSQRTSCSPDDWTTEHDRPPSPAPMDPHCHWPVVQMRQQPMDRSMSPSVSGSNSSQRRRHYRHSGSSCPTSPAIRDWDDGGVRGGAYRAGSRRWRQSMTREQQRLESQIAFLRRQLKDVTDDYYYDDDEDEDEVDYGHGTPSSSSESDSPRLK